MTFTYGSGQRVLDSYTIKRGVGRGGFGEVFYAVSDGGKDVALKLVRGANLETELRGMAQCLNLKHPNLLDLYDLRTDARGDHWVVMEYISGESLSNVLARHPNGLPRELTQQWFVELARAVGCLHGHGIVHRDLKPANIFLENGTVKVGDYGLSKFISSSQHTAQTQSVGTVHYMAPEISTGNYNKQIDIYAAGVILYEMLTGRVPFDGESAGEILMKHLTAPPDLSKVPADYIAAVGKALAKNPAHRYASMGEFARAVEHIGRTGQPAAETPPPRSVPVAAAVPPRAVRMARPVPPPAPPVASVRGQVAELCTSMVLSAIFTAVACTVWTAVAQPRWHEMTPAFFLTVAASWAVLVPAKLWSGRQGDSGARRGIMMLLGVLLGLGALWLDRGSLALAAPETWQVRESSENPLQELPLAAGFVSYFGLAFVALRWWKLAERTRSCRFSFGSMLATAFWAFILLPLWPSHDAPVTWAALPLLLTAGIVQMTSPWDAPTGPAPRRMNPRYS
jgi:hypothetical protein